MKRASPGTFILLSAGLISAVPAMAALDYYTYVVHKNVTRVLRNGSWTDSSYTTYDLSRLGSASLENSSISLTSHGSYLSVVEEAILSGNVEERPRDITYDFLLQGFLPIPPLAAVHALTVFHGDTVFRAQLRKSIYSLDDSFMDTAALKATLDARVAFLQQLGDGSFEASFTRLTLGEPVRVRIEYDLPFPGAPGSAANVPVLFHPSGNPPRQAQVAFAEAAKGFPPLQWLGPGGRVNLDDGGSHTLEYQASYQFRRDEAKGVLATLHAAGISAGPMKGQYLLFNAGLDDSLMDVLSRPLEVSFIWRWNPPFDFVEMQNGLKTLSAEGRLAVAEAQALKTVITEMAPRGHRFGLLHSMAGKAAQWFPPAALGSDGYKGLLAYLDGFSEQRLYADYKDYKDPRPDWAATAWKDSGEVIAARNEFLSGLARVRKGFSDGPESVEHIALLGLGAAPATEIDLKDPKALEAVLDSVTISNVNASWLGIDMGAALQVKANEALRPVVVKADLGYGPLTLMLPVFQPSSVEYRAFAAGRSHAVVMPFAADAGREAMLKASVPFDDSLELQGIDALGRKTRVHTLSPRVRRAIEDTGLARLWAADPDRISDAGETDLGMRYGILTKGSYLAAGVSDGKLQLPSGTPSAVLPKSVRVADGRTFRLDGGMLRLDSPQRIAGSAWLELFDLKGRLVARIDLEGYRSGNGFAIPLDRFARFGMSRLVLILRGAGRAEPFTLVLGGRP